MNWIFLRGLGREVAHWHGLPEKVAALVPHAVPVAMDLPGVGARRGQPGPASVDAFVDDLRALSREDRPVVLVGISFGGMIALEWTRRFPSEVAGLVLISSSVGGLSPVWQRLRPPALGDLLKIALWPSVVSREKQSLALVGALTATNADILDQHVEIARSRPVPRAVVARQLWAAARYRPQLSQVSCPCLVLAGAADRMVDPGAVRALGTQIGAKFAEHPTAGHDVPLDDPAWVVDHIARWWTAAGLRD